MNTYLVVLRGKNGQIVTLFLNGIDDLRNYLNGLIPEATLISVSLADYQK